MQAASDNAEELKDYLVTTGDMTSLKKRIEGFDSLKNEAARKDRDEQHRDEAAAEAVPQVGTLLTRRLDKLMVKLKAAQPNFYEEYQASRVVVTTAGRAAKKDEKKASTPPAKAA